MIVYNISMCVYVYGYVYRIPAFQPAGTRRCAHALAFALPPPPPEPPPLLLPLLLLRPLPLLLLRPLLLWGPPAPGSGPLDPLPRTSQAGPTGPQAPAPSRWQLPEPRAGNLRVGRARQKWAPAGAPHQPQGARSPSGSRLGPTRWHMTPTVARAGDSVWLVGGSRTERQTGCRQQPTRAPLKIPTQRPTRNSHPPYLAPHCAPCARQDQLRPDKTRPDKQGGARAQPVCAHARAPPGIPAQRPAWYPILFTLLGGNFPPHLPPPPRNPTDAPLSTPHSATLQALHSTRNSLSEWLLNSTLDSPLDSPLSAALRYVAS